jgi:hypothetical protein
MNETSKKCLTGKAEKILKPFIEYNDQSDKYMASKVECKQDPDGEELKLRNLETGKCVNASTDLGKEIQGIQTPCAKNEYHNGKNCVKFKQHFVEKWNELDEHISFYAGSLIQYFIDNHPHCALIKQKKNILDNKFLWNINPETKKRELTPPSGFDAFMDKALSDEKIRLIVLLVWVKNSRPNGTWHANAIIIDKKLRTLERYEPNAPRFSPNLDNDLQLDKAIHEFFKKYNFKKYINAINTCRADLHKLDWSELELNMANPEGNCMIWTTWYIHMRMIYPDIPRNDLTKFAVQEIKKMGSFKQYIDGYHAFLIRSVKGKGSST